jgi:phosphomannomutase/phosphoglucomutase
MMQELLNPSIFRAYDIRGIVDETLTEEVVHAIGQALGSKALEGGEKSLAIARDGRISGPKLLAALQEGILASGCHVINLGMVPTPLLYFANFVLESHSGVMLTGSHNPMNYNGLKMVINKKTLAEAEIQDLYLRILGGQFSHGKGQVFEENILPRYLAEVCKNITIHKPLKVVVDCGNSVPGIVVPPLLKRLGCEVYELFCDVDGSFPNHHPDPSQIENLEDLISKVQEVGADVGLAFDGDGDRLGVVTPKGEVLWPDRQLMLFAQDILSKNKGGKIIYDVKCSSHLDKVIRDNGGEPIMWKTGHSLIKAKLVETNALMAGEMSGHMFFNDRWFGFDDAIYAGVRFLEILSHTTQTVDEIFQSIPNSVNTPELKVHIADEKKFDLMQKLGESAKLLSATKILTIDGLRIHFENGWGLVRPSNTTPCLVLRFEAQSLVDLEMIKSTFREFLWAADPKLEITF